MQSQLIPTPRAFVQPTLWIAILLVVIVLGANFLPLPPLLSGTPSADAIGEGLAPTLIGLVVVCAAVTVLGWWRPVLTDRSRVHPSWGAVPAVFVVAWCGLIATGDYSADGTFLLAAIVSTVIVVVNEELIMRGVLITGLRGVRVPEWGVWLLSSLVFALAHYALLIGPDPAGFEDATAFVRSAFFLGTLAYLTRRVTGSLAACVVLHSVNNIALYGIHEDQWAREWFAGAGALCFYAALPVVIALLITEAARDRRRRGDGHAVVGAEPAQL
ncbi:CPBP family intramembrane glutamic endopeptidase [Microbacterium hydrocarbonoxydans]|uniref:CPBP family intramembrane glutamic endopeptidase n=1 Tax=Microbacterium hydrocarbonoxydans TaxID=273678 RepID=UPI002040AE44|nr:CPBP family intramembrane glutamic endopeptidase [Microbacterium hydrocarbonoxydans]MCM3780156.1 CPBP family intramembrane metalloprotease [Microbacterium hydrocarbonoxydans]